MKQLLVLLVSTMLLAVSATSAYAAEETPSLAVAGVQLTAQSMAEECTDYTIGEEWTGSPANTYFKFSLREDSHVFAEASTSGKCGEARMAIFNMVEKTISSWNNSSYSENSSKKITRHSCNLKAGDYYLQVYFDYHQACDAKLLVLAEPIVSLGRSTITSVSCPAANTAKVTTKAVDGALSYQYQFSTNTNFSKAKTIAHPGTTYTATGLNGGTYYYVRTRPFTVYNDGLNVYGNWSRAKSVYVKPLKNELFVTTKAKTLKYSTLKKKKQTFLYEADDTAGAKLAFAIASVPSKAKKYITIKKSTGAVTVKKGLAKGTYKLKVKTSAAAKGKYGATSTTKALTIKVK